MTAAQKTAKAKFKQAIAYRQKTGVSLKEAFAHIYGKKIANTRKLVFDYLEVPKGKKPKLVKVIGKVSKKEVGKIDYDKAFKKQMQVNKIINTKYKNWEYPVPPVYTGNWSALTWSNWIKKNGKKIGAIKKKVAKKVVRKVVKKKAATKKVAKKKLTPRDYDKRYSAKKPGKRTSASGNTYYESRPNRSDKGKLLGFNDITLTRINNDLNGNPRYVVHFLNVLNNEEQSFLPFNKKYEYALKKAKLIGGKKYDNKQYGGGIVFGSIFNSEALKQKINNLMQTTPKIKY